MPKTWSRRPSRASCGRCSRATARTSRSALTSSPSCDARGSTSSRRRSAHARATTCLHSNRRWDTSRVPTSPRSTPLSRPWLRTPTALCPSAGAPCSGTRRSRRRTPRRSRPCSGSRPTVSPRWRTALARRCGRPISSSTSTAPTRSTASRPTHSWVRTCAAGCRRGSTPRSTITCAGASSAPRWWRNSRTSTVACGESSRRCSWASRASRRSRAGCPSAARSVRQPPEAPPAPQARLAALGVPRAPPPAGRQLAGSRPSPTASRRSPSPRRRCWAWSPSS